MIKSLAWRIWIAGLSIIVIGMLSVLPGRASGAPADSRKKVVLVVLNNTRVEDLFAGKRKNISRLIDSGAAGLMNAKAASGEYAANHYLSLGAGARANADALGGRGFNASERLPERLFEGRLTGGEVSFQNNGLRPPEKSVVNLGVNFAAATSFRYHNNILPGLLGETLNRAGLKTAVVGNADVFGVEQREITLITMDFDGITDYGDVSRDMLRADAFAPGGLRSDTRKLAQSVLDMTAKADFVAVEFGDTSRFGSQRAQMRKTRFLGEREKALSAADAFIGRLTRSLPMERTMLVITSPQPMKDQERGMDNLVPIIITGLGKGALVSDTTRRDGIVANMDIAPTILNYLGVSAPVEMAGSVMRPRPRAGDAVTGFLSRRHSQIYAIRLARMPFLAVYSVLTFLGLAAGLLAVVMAHGGRPLKERYVGAIQFALLLLLSLPIACFVRIPLDETNGVASWVSFAISASIAGAAAFLIFRRRPMLSLAIVTGVTALMIAADTLGGAIFADRSFFGSDIMAGGRFYGLGNTLMGILVAAAVFSAASFLELSRAKGKSRLWLAAGAVMLTGVLIGHARIGANVGGLITGVATALIFFHVVGRARFTASSVLASAAVFVGVVVSVMRLDLSGGAGTSHAGKAMAVIGDKGGSAVLDIISRKLDMAIRGTFSFDMAITIAMVALIFAFLGAIGVRRTDWVEWLGWRFGAVSRGFFVLFWASFIAYAFNDTGAVAAHFILNYAAIPLVCLALEFEDIAGRDSADERKSVPTVSV